MDIADTESWSKLSLRLPWARLSLLLGESVTWLVAALSAPQLWVNEEIDTAVIIIFVNSDQRFDV